MPVLEEEFKKEVDAMIMVELENMKTLSNAKAKKKKKKGKKKARRRAKRRVSNCLDIRCSRICQ